MGFEIVLNILWTHPGYQRKGVGKLIMDWGVKRAVDLDIETWLDASPFGKGLYEQFGFTTVEQLNITPQQDPPNEAWAKVKSDLGEMMSEAMWRPSESQCKKSIKGKDMKPWDLEKED